MNEPTINERYAQYVAEIGTQSYVAEKLGVGVKTVNARCGKREIKPEAMLAIQALYREEKRKAIISLVGMTAVYADGSEGRIVHHDPVDGPAVLFEDGTIHTGGNFTIKQQ